MDMVGILAKLGLNTSEFKQGLKNATEESKNFEKGWKDLGKLFAAGGIATAVYGFFREVIEYSKNAKGALDENVAAVKRFGNSIDETKEDVMNLGAQVLGVANRVGEWIGHQMAVIRYGKQQVAIADQIEKQTRQTLENIERDRKQTEEIGKIRGQILETQKKATEEAEKQLPISVQLGISAQRLQAAQDGLLAAEGNKLATARAELVLAQERARNEGLRRDQAKETAEAEKKALEERAKVQAKLADQEEKDAEEAEKREDLRYEQRQKLNKLKFDALPLEDQIAQLENQQAKLQEDIYIRKAKGLDVTSAEIDLIELGNGLTGKRSELIRKNASETRQAIDEEAARIKKIVADANAWLGGMATLRGGQQFNELSDEALNSIITKNRAQAADVSNVALYGSTQARANAMEASRLIFEADNAASVIAMRNKLRSDVAMFGVEGARRNFTGDATQFDSLVQKWVADTRTQTEILRSAADAMLSIDARLSYSGLRK